MQTYKQAFCTPLAPPNCHIMQNPQSAWTTNCYSASYTFPIAENLIWAKLYALYTWSTKGGTLVQEDFVQSQPIFVNASQP